MSEFCGDNRFEIINKVKKRLLENTNIEQSPKELEVLDNLLFRLWQCGYFDYIETFEKNKMTFEEWYKKSDCELTGVSIGIARCIFQVGAKEMRKELEQKFIDSNKGWNNLVTGWVLDYKELEKENERLTKRICELQADLGRTRDLLKFQNDKIANKNIFKPVYELKPLSENDQTLYFVKDISGRITLATAAEILRDMACGCFFTEFALVEDALKLYSSINHLDTLSLNGDGQCYLKNILEIFLRELSNLENQTKENLAPENFVAQKILKQLNNMSYFLCAEAYRKTSQARKGKE